MKYWINNRGQKFRALSCSDGVSRESFNRWVDYFDTVDWQIGDLARDIQIDKSFPELIGYEGFSTGYSYLQKKGAIDNCVNTFVDSYVLYMNSNFLKEGRVSAEQLLGMYDFL